MPNFKYSVSRIAVAKLRKDENNEYFIDKTESGEFSTKQTTFCECELKANSEYLILAEVDNKDLN